MSILEYVLILVFKCITGAKQKKTTLSYNLPAGSDIFPSLPRLRLCLWQHIQDNAIPSMTQLTAVLPPASFWPCGSLSNHQMSELEGFL